MPVSDKGLFSNRKIERVDRNKHKLQDAETDLERSEQKIIEQTNKLNMEKFETFNPIVKKFIKTEMGTNFLVGKFDEM